MKTILIVEDDPYLSRLLAELLASDQRKCLVARSASEFETLFTKHRQSINCLILDLMMMRSGSFLENNGSESETGDLIYRYVRNLDKNLPILIITAKIKENLVIDYTKFEDVKILFKPLSRDSLNEIEKWLKNI